MDKHLNVHEQLHEAESYIERQKEYIEQLEHENKLLYGRLNMIHDLTKKEIN